MTTSPDSLRDYHGRFAPTPSGPLHAGSLVAALGSFLDARAHGGRWSLRIDDTDRARSRPEAVETIIAQLHAHGLAFDGEVIFQSQRTPQYEAALRSLERFGRLYRCRCTRARLREWAASHGRIIGAVGPLYPGFCRDAPASVDERHALRLRVHPHRRAVPDRRLGTITQQLEQDVGDPVLRRADGPIAYHLANVVDDADMGITQVVRGEDLAPLTPLHVELSEALGIPAPDYLHLPVVLGEDGRKLSKTNHARPLENGRARENLIKAARTLGMEPSPADSDASIDELLQRWREEWQYRHPLAG